MNRHSRLWLMAIALFANGAAAQVFECTNAKGVKEFAQFCPPGTVQERRIGKSKEDDDEPAAASPAAPAAPAGAAPKSIEVQEVEFRKRALERQEADTKAEREKAKAEEFERHCVEARAQLQALLEGQRMTRIDPETRERIQFSDEDRAADVERQRQAITQWCK